MGAYDPNDPNMGSQAPSPDGGVPSGGLSLDALVKSRPTVAQWLSAHNGGRDLSNSQIAQLFSLIQQSGIDPTMLEIDHNGNFNAGTGHTLRDIAYGSLLAFGPVVAAWAVPAIAGASAGAGAGTAAATTASTAGPATAANLAATSAIVGGSTVPPSLAAVGGTVGTAGTVGSILKNVLPVAGDVVKGLIQANASGNASDAQQKYLEEALAYQKESDAYQRQIDANKVVLDAQRYGDYQGRIAPWIANGTSSNDRMSALLGLAPRAGASSASGGSSGVGESGDPTAYADRLSAADKLKVDALLKASNSSDNPNYWYGVNAQHGGFDATGADWNQRRISTGDGVGKGYVGPSTAAPTAPTAAAPTTPQPQAPASVQMRGPDGSVKTVSADQVDHYKSLGATVLGGAA